MANMKDMKDSESGVAPQQKVNTIQRVKGYFLEFKVLTGAAMALCMLSAVFAVTLLAAHCGMLPLFFLNLMLNSSD
ncbi:hypothetical protein GGI35DRAFT_441658 [Trichoderma velutinum]